jgi:acetylornithine deacetylase/succinyl-diaminopimelate desuccinylase-like protein
MLWLGFSLDYEKQLSILFSRPTSTSEPTLPIEIRPKDVVWEMLERVDQERILKDLRRLTGEEPICTENGCYTITGRETGSEGLRWAKDYVNETLVSLGYEVEIMNWSRDGYKDQNIITRKRGLVYPDEEIYFIAHLDGYLDNNPAADDDASGAVSLLELARILSGRSLSRTVVIFFSTGEEHGSLGSRSYVNQISKRQLNAIKYLVSIEMLGYDSNNDGKMELWTGDDSLDFVEKLSKIIYAYDISLVPVVFTDCY